VCIDATAKDVNCGYTFQSIDELCEDPQEIAFISYKKYDGCLAAISVAGGWPCGAKVSSEMIKSLEAEAQLSGTEALGRPGFQPFCT